MRILHVAALTFAAFAVFNGDHLYSAIFLVWAVVFHGFILEDKLDRILKE